jgi:hypothetical protein
VLRCELRLLRLRRLELAQQHVVTRAGRRRQQVDLLVEVREVRVLARELGLRRIEL